MKDTVGKMGNTSQLSETVSTSYEQMRLIAQETATSTQMTAASQKGSAAMEEVSASVSELAKQSENLRALISNFKI